jgi:hypothetical protein
MSCFAIPLCHLRLVLALCFLVIVIVPAAAQQPDDYGLNITASQNIDSAGNAQVRWVMNFNPPRGYDRVKRIYPNLYVLFRDFGPNRSGMEINRDTLKISSDDGQHSISFNADVLGLAISRNNRWQIELAPNEQVSTQDENRVFTVLQVASQNALKMSIINSYVLPHNANNVHIDKENRLLTYTLPAAKVAPSEEPVVDVSVRYKKRLMAALYKIYGDMQAQDGDCWTAKTIFKNTGKAPIYGLKIYYRLGDYTEMSVPEAYSMVLPGGAVVDRYYPVIQSTVTQLRTPTPLQLYVRYEYKDAAGRPYSSELTRRLEMLGINQFEFSNLNDEDRSDNWLDSFNNAPLLAAFVTRVDDPVKQFAGFISEKSGGAAANSSKEAAVQWLKAAYEMELANNIVYQTPSTFLTPDHSSGQDIKFPRDVFRDKSGTCVDLAITYAALAESVGLEAYLMLVPEHAFPVIRLPNGELLAVESTGLGGGDQRASFEQVVDYGKKEWLKYREEGVYYLIDVSEQWTMGRVPNPELQAVGIDFLEHSGIRRMGAVAAGGPASRGQQSFNQQGAGQQVAGQQPILEGKQFRVVHDHGFNNLVTYCVGTLTITADSVVYQASMANDGRRDQFRVRKTDIKEARKNRLPMNQNGLTFPAFHIRLQNGLNFNFALLDENNRGMDADPVLTELIQ